MGRISAWLAAAPLLWLGAAAATPLTILVDASTAMPMALVTDGKLTGGIHQDVGAALARVLGARPVFVIMPRKRIAQALEQGGGDLACHFLPEWLPGKVDWSELFMPNALLLLSNPRVARPASLAALRGVPIGTVLGFAYPDVERVLGARFVRDDAVDATGNLLKFDAGRANYALTGEVFLRYQQRHHGLGTGATEALVVRRYLASCAVARRGPFPLARINRAIATLRASKELEAIYQRYR